MKAWIVSWQTRLSPFSGISSSGPTICSGVEPSLRRSITNDLVRSSVSSTARRWRR